MKSALVVVVVVAASCGLSPATAPHRALLTHVDVVAPGIACAGGGVHVVAGLDANADGRLERGEIESDRVTCNGAVPARDVLDPAPPSVTTAVGLSADASFEACKASDAIQQTVAIGAGAVCADGGSETDLACDENGDGAVQAGEILWKVTACNAPAETAARVDVEPPGAHCFHGGVAVKTGLDTDRDGVLDDSEVQHTAFICNGSGGDDTLVSFDDEPAGPNCADGGLAVHSGLDLDHDGALDPNEITSTSFLCENTAPPLDCSAFDDVATGTFVVESAADAAALSGVDCIDGSLLIAGVTSTLPALSLVRVTGDVFVLGNPGLANLNALAALADVGREFNTSNNAALTTLAGLSAFQGSGTRFAVSDNAHLTSLGALSSVTALSRVEITHNPKLTSTGLTSLERAFNVFVIDNDALTDGNLFPALTATDGASLVVTGNDALTTLSMPAYAQCGFAFQIAGNAALRTVSFPSLAFAGNFFELDGPSLQSASFPSLSSVSADLSVLSSPLTSLDLSGLVVVGRSFTLQGLPALTGVNASRLIAIGNSLDVNQTGLTSLTGLLSLSSTGLDLIVTNNAALPTAQATAFAAGISVGGTTTISGNGP